MNIPVSKSAQRKLEEKKILHFSGSDKMLVLELASNFCSAHTISKPVGCSCYEVLIQNSI